MSSTFGLLVVVPVAVSAAVQVFTDPRIHKKFIVNSLGALAIYFIHAIVGILTLYLLMPLAPHAAKGVALALVGWIGLGALGLIRFAPRLHTPPKLLLHFGAIDILFLLMIAGGLVAALG